MSKDYVKLGKTISYVLRHKPEEFGLSLDQEGFVLLDDLLTAVKCSKDDLLHIIETSEKKRFEIIEDKIRATYGHSTSKKIIREQAIPPAVLYHGTARRFLFSIMENGLLPMNRQYVHLSEDIKTAKMVGKRRDDTPLILSINTKAAMAGGVKFYLGNDTTWLSDPIPFKYTVIEVNSYISED